MEFVHLHLHSEYSLLDGACRIADIPRTAKAAGHSAVALTDHGNLYGAVAFYRACKAEGIKPILGCEMYYTAGGAERTRDNYHLILLVKNEVGYRNLCYLSSKSYTDHFYGKPRITAELLAAHSEGLICLSACIGGYIPQMILAERADEAEAHAKWLRSLFGDDFYLEIQAHGLTEEAPAFAGVTALAEKLQIPLVATNDVHYLRKRDADAQAILMCIQTNTVIADGRPMGFETDEFYYKSTEEMAALFAAHPTAISNTAQIAEKCNFDYRFDQTYLPEFAVPNGEDTAAYLRRLTAEGMERRVASGELVFDAEYTRERYMARANYELDVIVSMGYDGYYLIVQDFVMYAKQNGISVGPGRGSGAGSLVAYLVGITDVDSIRYDLLFERFLNPERVSMPDFDIDFCYVRRGEVIRYVTEKYGVDHVSQIVTFGTMAARAVVRDVGRALGLSYADVDAIAKRIPREMGVTLDAAIRQNKELGAIYEGGGAHARLLDTAMLLEGMPRHASTHAAGVVITPRPLYEYLPLAVGKDTVVTQFDMDTVAALGLLKFDFLGLRYLTILDDTEQIIKATRPQFSLTTIPMEDAATFDLLCAGKTDGIFQLESAGMRRMLTEFRPRSVDDIMLAIALYRPGPMDSIPKLIANRKYPARVNYALPALAEILGSTYGCIVYQEQVMQICRRVAGYTFGRADSVRRAMAKKKADAMAKERDAFLAGAEENGIPAATATALFDEMVSFAHYAFNKSHAAAYAIVAYRSAYLKAHYPREYMASLLTSVLGNPDKTAAYIVEANRLGITVSPPDINHSEMYYTADKEHTIRFGLLAIKNVGQNFVEAVLAERTRRPFTSFLDFVDRMSAGEINRLQVEGLIKAGCFDGFADAHRAQLLAAAATIVEQASAKHRGQIAGQLDLFSMLGAEMPTPTFAYPDTPPLSAKEMLLLERESTGFYFSGHLLDDYTAHIDTLSVVSSAELREAFDEDGRATGSFTEKQLVSVAGIVTRRQNKQTRKGDAMAFLTLEDRTGETELVIFPKVLETVGAYLTLDSAITASGELSVKEGEAPSILVRTIEPLIANTLFVPSTPMPAPEMPAPTPEAPAKGVRFTPNAGGGVRFTPYADAPVPQTQTRGVRFAPSAPPPPASAVPTPPAQVNETAPIRKLFLRLPSVDDPLAKRARAMVGIFEGNTPISYYYADTKTYVAAPAGVQTDVFVLTELRKLLGADNVVCK